LCLASLLGCGLTPTRISRDDQRLKPMWAAVSRVDRESLGFTAIPANATIRLEGKQAWGNDYDAMLHIDAETSRTIAFRKIGGSYDWIGEQEIHTGPKSYRSVDGTFKETITITYELAHVSGAPLNQLSVTYLGEDPRLAGRKNLTLAEIRPVLREWKQHP
jgi:hypothetical protein